MKNTENNDQKSLEKEDWYSWYQAFDQTHTPEQRREWYSNAAIAYRQARPRYPQSVLQAVVQQAQLIPDSHLLELGCGPGIATADLASQEFAIQAVEPSPAACKLARQACKAYPNVKVTTSTFENWPLPVQKFDAVLAATSFHWISPDIACKKSAAALKPDGSLILLWATPPQPAPDVLDLIQPVYEQHNLGDIGNEQRRSKDYYLKSFATFANLIGNSGYFKMATVKATTYRSYYSIEKYIALLSTLSPYIALEPTMRNRLFKAIAQTLTGYTSADLKTTHHIAYQVSPRNPSA